MNSPNVNWALFKMIEEEIKVEKIASLMSIGSCALYIFHGTFENEAKKS